MRDKIIAFLQLNAGSTTAYIAQHLKSDDMGDWIAVRAELDAMVRDGVVRKSDVQGFTLFYLNQ